MPTGQDPSPAPRPPTTPGSFSLDTVNTAMSRYVLHDTTDPDVFIAEIDTVFEGPQGHGRTLPLVQIFRLREGQIAMLRDYFSVQSTPT